MTARVCRWKWIGALVLALAFALLALPAYAQGDLGQAPVNGFCSRGEPMLVNGALLCVGCGEPGEFCCTRSGWRCLQAQDGYGCRATPTVPQGVCARTEPRDLGPAGCGYPGHPPCPETHPLCHSGRVALSLGPQFWICQAAGANGQPCRVSGAYPCDGASTCIDDVCLPGEGPQEWCRKFDVEADAALQTRDWARYRAAVANLCTRPCPNCQAGRARLDQWTQTKNQECQQLHSEIAAAEQARDVARMRRLVERARLLPCDFHDDAARRLAALVPVPPANVRTWKVTGALTTTALPPVNVRVTGKSASASHGSVQIEYENTNRCRERYEMRWDFSAPVNTLTKGDRIGVHLQTTRQGASCGNALSSYVGVEGPRIDDFLLQAVPDRSQVEQAMFRATGGRADANSANPHGSAQVTLEVLASPTPDGRPRTAFLRFYVYVPGYFYVVAYRYDAQ